MSARLGWLAMGDILGPYAQLGGPGADELADGLPLGALFDLADTDQSGVLEGREIQASGFTSRADGQLTYRDISFPLVRLRGKKERSVPYFT